MLIPVVLSGGAGSRLWPVSRKAFPKPFMKLSDGESLLYKTYHRASTVAEAVASNKKEILTVTNREYFFMSRDEFYAVGIEDQCAGSYLLEPIGRNTAPAVVMAAHHIVNKFGPQAVMLVMPADHLIQDLNAFSASVKKAKALADIGKLVTFGITPTEPNVGFGYIETGEAIDAGNKVVRFVEKPDIAHARKYLAAGNYLWNSGMFCFRAESFLEEVQSVAPDLYKHSQDCWAAMSSNNFDSTVTELPMQPFSNLPDISLDFAVMERSENIAVVSSAMGWSDIGAWDAVGDLVESDCNQNRAIGEAIFLDSKNTFVRSEDRLVATVGTSDLMIIDTADALLVARSDKAQDVKKVVAQLKKENHSSYKLHRTVCRPWGKYTVLEEAGQFKIKRIEVKPGRSLSLQMHHHRSEHWIVVSGTAKIVNGEIDQYILANESTYIPAGCRHRLENPGVIDLVIIEVQCGEYLGEDDIVRFEDKYGRA